MFDAHTVSSGKSRGENKKKDPENQRSKENTNNHSDASSAFFSRGKDSLYLLISFSAPGASSDSVKDEDTMPCEATYYQFKLDNEPAPILVLCLFGGKKFPQKTSKINLDYSHADLRNILTNFNFCLCRYIYIFFPLDYHQHLLKTILTEDEIAIFSQKALACKSLSSKTAVCETSSSETAVADIPSIALQFIDGLIPKEMLGKLCAVVDEPHKTVLIKDPNEIQRFLSDDAQAATVDTTSFVPS